MVRSRLEICKREMQPQIICPWGCFMVDVMQAGLYSSAVRRRTYWAPSDPWRLNFDSSENMTLFHWATVRFWCSRPLHSCSSHSLGEKWLFARSAGSQSCCQQDWSHSHWNALATHVSGQLTMPADFWDSGAQGTCHRRALMPTCVPDPSFSSQIQSAWISEEA